MSECDQKELSNWLERALPGATPEEIHKAHSLLEEWGSRDPNGFPAQLAFVTRLFLHTQALASKELIDSLDEAKATITAEHANANKAFAIHLKELSNEFTKSEVVRAKIVKSQKDLLAGIAKHAEDQERIASNQRLTMRYHALALSFFVSFIALLIASVIKGPYVPIVCLILGAIFIVLALKKS